MGGRCGGGGGGGLYSSRAASMKFTHMREMSWVRGAALLRLTGVWFARSRTLDVDSSFAWKDTLGYVTDHHQNYL